jgi:hypothetical protein
MDIMRQKTLRMSDFSPSNTTQDVIAKVRNEALEEAAVLCEHEDSGFFDRWDCADNIRALKTEVK